MAAPRLQTPGSVSCPGHELLPTLDNTFLALATQYYEKGVAEVVAAALGRDCKTMMSSCRPADTRADHTRPAQA